MQGSPLGCVQREIPGVTQVDETGHGSNTAVFTAQLVGAKMAKTALKKNHCW